MAKPLKNLKQRISAPAADRARKSADRILAKLLQKKKGQARSLTKPNREKVFSLLGSTRNCYLRPGPLVALYDQHYADLRESEFHNDIDFYRNVARQTQGPVLDLG